MDLTPAALRTLGGRGVISSTKLHSVRREVSRGLPSTVLGRVEKVLGLSPAESARIFGVSPATRKRILRARSRKLDVSTGDRAVRVARVFGEAVDHFGNDAAAARWLRSALDALDGLRPLDLLDTDLGAQTVSNLIAQMEHGVYS